MAKNIYYAWASNDQGASTDVASGTRTNSKAEIKRLARKEFGAGWKIHVMEVFIDGDGKSVMGVEEIESFRIRGSNSPF